MAAHSENDAGENPAGSFAGDSQPTDAEMQAIALATGYIETAFAAATGS